MGKQTNTPREWRLLAARDISVADHLAATMKPVPTEVIAFHCQQAVEKYLKGVLVVLGEEPPYIHDLDRLCSMVLEHLPSFSSISSLCTTVNYFSVQPRYDFGLSLSEDNMRIVLAHTKTIKEFLQKEIPELFEELR
ncbi:MAG: HEPN domain-containing protein [Spirochaetaceae bacterium]|nr:HEPN domain-containing protein [Spirochaetaceae bacterium]